MAARDLVVIGGSAGSLTPLTTLIQGLPSSFPASVLVAIHASPESPGNLARIVMPRNALTHVNVDYVLSAAAIAPLLRRETQVPPEREVAMGDSDLEDPQVPGGKTDIARMNAELGPPSALTCPDCGGALWQIDEGRLVRTSVTSATTTHLKVLSCSTMSASKAHCGQRCAPWRSERTCVGAWRARPRRRDWPLCRKRLPNRRRPHPNRPTRFGTCWRI
jgi:hypothetical protein